MASLLEALSDGSYDFQNNRNMSGSFVRDLITYRTDVVNKYLHGKTDLNESIAQIATEKLLTDEQIKRVLEEVNNQVYLILYERMKSSPEREVSFDLADFNKIKGKISGMGKTNVVTKMAEAFSDAESHMEKTASENISIDSIAGTRNISSALDIDHIQIGAKRAMIRGMVDEIKAKENFIEKRASAALNNACIIAEALIQYKKTGEDVNVIFGDLVKGAGMDTGTQRLVKQAIENQIGRDKQAGKLFDEFEVVLTFHDPSTPKKYSLGKNSFYEKSSGEKLAGVEVSGIGISGIERLTDIARDLVSEVGSLKEAKAEYREMEKKASQKSLDISKADRWAIPCDGKIEPNHKKELDSLIERAFSEL